MPTDLPFNLNAPGRTGQGPYGLVPGNIGLPPVYNDVAGVFPNLSGNLAQFSRNVGSALRGELSDPTIAMLQNTAAQFGIGQGTPLSPFSGAAGLRHVARATEEQQARGANELLSALPTIARTLTVQPETQLNVADRNATLNAAPDPAKAAAEAQRLFDLYMAKLMGRTGGGVQFGGGGGGGSSRGPAGGTGVFDSPWASFQPEAVRGGQPYTPPYQGSGITWGTTQAQPQDLWAPQGPELDMWGGQGPELNMWGIGATGGAGTPGDTDYWDEWFGWDNTPGAGVPGDDQKTPGYWDDWFGGL